MSDRLFYNVCVLVLVGILFLGVVLFGATTLPIALLLAGLMLCLAGVLCLSLPRRRRGRMRL
ncbi:MAG: hypothetical protein AAGH45_09710, partial [Pseudomonadota bacterium]